MNYVLRVILLLYKITQTSKVVARQGHGIPFQPRPDLNETSRENCWIDKTLLPNVIDDLKAALSKIRDDIELV